MGAKILIRGLLFVVVTTFGTACVDSSIRLQNLAKSDVDFITDAHYRATQRLLRELTVKLYRRNPSQLAKSPGISLERRVAQLFDHSGPLVFSELQLKQGTEALLLALDKDFPGDRVFAVMAGLNGMIRHAYGYRGEFFMLDRLDEQKLYQSARNVEILVWRLSHAKDANAEPLLLTNSQEDEVENLSFERLFGKLIAVQDMMATVVSQQNDRLISRVAQNVASMVFFPL